MTTSRKRLPRRKPSLRLFIGAAITVMVTLTAGAVMVNAYLAGRSNAETVMAALGRSAVEQTTQKVLSFLQPARDAAGQARAHLGSGTLTATPEALERYFFDVLSVNHGIALMGYADEHGNWTMVRRMSDGSIDTKTIERTEGGRRTRWLDRGPGASVTDIQRTWEDPSDTFEPRQRPWYVGAQKTRGMFWTDAYVFYTERQPGITVSVPYLDDGVLRGVVCVDIALADLSGFLARLRVGEAGQAVLLDEHGRLVASPRSAEVVTEVGDTPSLRPMADSRIPAIAAMAQSPLLPELGRPISHRTIPVEVGNERFVGSVGTIPVGAHDWTIAVVVPEAEFLGPIEASNTRSAITSALLVAVALLVSLLLARWIARSLDTLVRETELIRGLHFSERSAADSPFREVSEVLTAFEEMKVGLRAFQKYLPVKLVRKLLENHEEPRLGGEFMELTIYFSDIADFTPINERMHPMEMARRLGHYLASLTELIEDEYGTVVQYVGDEIMALWGAPNPVSDHAVRACDAALACADRARTLWSEDSDIPPFHTRFGVHTARVAVGHFGSSDRLYYGAIGDGINLASRLEGANKYYGTEVLISEHTQRLVSSTFVTRLVDHVAVKGREGAITIYELVGRRDALVLSELRWVTEYEAAFEQYMAGRFGAALQGFRNVLAFRPDDRPAQLMIERCHRLLESPPAKNWRGVHVMTAK